ncbi:MAG TPA: hypothetical protein DDX84_11535 [Nitrospiraceae bacterium]|nr:hypothetical protein [Nitrospiraceae bacterium]
MKILVIDDDDISSTLISKILQSKGYQTLVTPSAKKGFEYLEAGEPIVMIILDLMMPDMDGLTFLENVHKRPGLSDLPIIICSGDRFRESVLNTIKSGAKDYILKPIIASILLDKTDKVMQAEGLPLKDKYLITSRLKIENETYDEMLMKLIRNTTSVLHEISELIKNQDYNKLIYTIVGLKGGAMNMGAERLSNVLSKIEKASKDHNLDIIKDMVIALKRELKILPGLTGDNKILSEEEMKVLKE